jgi:lipopolysaccharide transport system permease protein
MIRGILLQPAQERSKQVNFIRDYWDLLNYRVLIEAKNETRQLYMGLAWWVLEPAAYMTVMYLIFGVLLQRGGPGFIGFLLVGFVMWRWIDGTVKKAVASITAAKPVLSQTQLPAWIFPISDALSVTLRFLIVLVLLILFCVFYSGQFGWAYLALPLVFGLNLLFNLSLGLLLALLPPFFPDSRKIIDNLFTLLFFASGIFFDLSRMDNEFAQYLHLNPLATFLTAYRGIMLDGVAPSPDTMLWPAACTALVFLAAVLCYRRLQPKLAKALLR